MGTPEGVKKIRTVHRLSIDKRWDPEGFNQLRGLPWKRDAVDSHELPVEQQLRPLPEHQGSDETAQLPQSNIPIQPRSFKIFKSDIMQHGYTVNCPGCIAQQQGRE